VSLVVDASVVAEVLIGSGKGQAAQPALRAHDVHAPELLYVEVVSVLRGWLRGGLVTQARAEQALQDLRLFPVHSWPHAGLTARMWQLRNNVSAYDAAYVALAETLGFPLLTTDARLARAVGSAVGCLLI